MKTLRQIKEELEIPAIGQTLSRDLMPQIDSAFLKYLKSKDISYTKEQLNTADLKSTQSEFDDMKILSLMSNNDTDPIFVSNDNYVLDGHHRWIADHNTDGKTDAYVIDLPILELLRVAKEYESMLKEEVTHKDFGPMMDAFVSFASDKLGIKSLPKINYKNDDEQGEQPSFGGYNPSSNEIIICTKNRHPMDVFRTLAHELVHHKQNEDGRIKDVSKEGSTGHPIEDEANSLAGRLMRWFGKANPDKFALSHIVEEKLNTEGSLHKWFQSKSSDGKRGWVQIGGKYHGKPCARQPGQTSTPKCRSSDEASRMTKDEIKYAVAKKRREDPNQPKKTGGAKPTRVATYKEKNMNEEKDIKGKGSGKKDSCYHKVKARYDVWPSAYASGALVKCRKVGADNWGKKSVDEEFAQLDESRRMSFKAKREAGIIGKSPSREKFEAMRKELLYGHTPEGKAKKAMPKMSVEEKDELAHKHFGDLIEKVNRSSHDPSAPINTTNLPESVKALMRAAHYHFREGIKIANEGIKYDKPDSEGRNSTFERGKRMISVAAHAIEKYVGPQYKSLMVDNKTQHIFKQLAEPRDRITEGSRVMAKRLKDILFESNTDEDPFSSRELESGRAAEARAKANVADSEVKQISDFNNMVEILAAHLEKHTPGSEFTQTHHARLLRAVRRAIRAGAREHKKLEGELIDRRLGVFPPSITKPFKKGRFRLVVPGRKPKTVPGSLRKPWSNK